MSPEQRILSVAADKFESNEWRWGKARAGCIVPRGCECVLTAIDCAAEGLDCVGYVSAAQRRLVSIIGVEKISQWNDDPSRRKAHVIAALRKAAA